jgi:hypothetical protein
MAMATSCMLFTGKKSIFFNEFSKHPIYMTKHSMSMCHRKTLVNINNHLSIQPFNLHASNIHKSRKYSALSSSKSSSVDILLSSQDTLNSNKLNNFHFEHNDKNIVIQNTNFSDTINNRDTMQSPLIKNKKIWNRRHLLVHPFSSFNRSRSNYNNYSTSQDDSSNVDFLQPNKTSLSFSHHTQSSVNSSFNYDEQINNINDNKIENFIG